MWVCACVCQIVYMYHIKRERVRERKIGSQWWEANSAYSCSWYKQDRAQTAPPL